MFKSGCVLFAVIKWRRKSSKTWDALFKSEVIRSSDPSAKEPLEKCSSPVKVPDPLSRIIRANVCSESDLQSSNKKETLSTKIHLTGNRHHEEAGPQKHCPPRRRYWYHRLHSHRPLILWPRKPTHLPGPPSRKNFSHLTGTESTGLSPQRTQMHPRKELHS